MINTLELQEDKQKNAVDKEPESEQNNRDVSEANINNET